MQSLDRHSPFLQLHYARCRGGRVSLVPLVLVRTFSPAVCSVLLSRRDVIVLCVCRAHFRVIWFRSIRFEVHSLTPTLSTVAFTHLYVRWPFSRKLEKSLITLSSSESVVWVKRACDDLLKHSLALSRYTVMYSPGAKRWSHCFASRSEERV